MTRWTLRGWGVSRDGSRPGEGAGAPGVAEGHGKGAQSGKRRLRGTVVPRFAILLLACPRAGGAGKQLCWGQEQALMDSGFTSSVSRAQE